jgi:hypothetical protein
MFLVVDSYDILHPKPNEAASLKVMFQKYLVHGPNLIIKCLLKYLGESSDGYIGMRFLVRFCPSKLHSLPCGGLWINQKIIQTLETYPEVRR